MGLDGGTYATRADILRRQSWKVAQSKGTRSTRGGSVSTSSVHQEPCLDRGMAQVVAWSTCLLSGKPLANPVMCDYLGHLYNRDAIVEFLLGCKDVFLDEAARHRYLNIQRTSAPSFQHLKSLRDVFVIYPTCNTNTTSTTAAINTATAATAGRGMPLTSASDTIALLDGEPPFTCPITMLPCGRYPFSALPTCGHVISDRALTSVGYEECPVCSQPYFHEQLVTINGSDEQVAQLRTRLPLATTEAAKRAEAARGAVKGGGSKKRKEKDREVRQEVTPCKGSTAAGTAALEEDVIAGSSKDPDASQHRNGDSELCRGDQGFLRAGDGTMPARHIGCAVPSAAATLSHESLKSSTGVPKGEPGSPGEARLKTKGPRCEGSSEALTFDDGGQDEGVQVHRPNKHVKFA